MEVVMKIVLDESVKSMVSESDVLHMLKAVGFKHCVDELFIDEARLRVLVDRATVLEKTRSRTVLLWEQLRSHLS